MERKEFIKQAAGFGLCSCAVASLFAAVAGCADEPAKPADQPPEDWRLGFMRQRFATLLGALEKRIDGKALDAALGQMGATCAASTPFLAQYAGDPEGFMAELRRRWHGQIDYDPARGVLTVAFEAGGECPCALVRKGMTPHVMCQCSLGWQQHAWSMVFGRPAEPRLVQSLLRGGTKCEFEVHVSPA